MTYQAMAKKSCALLGSKVYLMLFNVIFLLCGFALLGVGLWMHLSKEQIMYLHIVRGPTTTPIIEKMPFIFIGLGAVIAFLCFMGCCGACMESTCFLCSYSIILMVIVFAQIISIIVLAVNRHWLVGELLKAMENQIRYDYNRTSVPDRNRTDLLTIAWDAMQYELQCCGANSPHDYEFSAWWNHTRPKEGLEVPHTCCVLRKGNSEFPIVRDNNQCQVEAIVYPQWIRGTRDPGRQVEFTELHTTGCYHALLVWAEENEKVVISFLSLLAVILLLQILAFAFACVLIMRQRKEQDKEVWCEEEEEE